MRRYGVVPLIAATGLLAPAAAQAAIGTGVSASPISLAKPAAAGRSYALPQLLVVNTGTVGSRYHVRVQRLSPGRARTIPVSWVKFGRNDFWLNPHRSAIVPVSVTIPNGAATGSYLSDVVASTTTAHRHGGTALGAAAATLLQLSVKDSPGTLPWLPGGLALVGLAVLAFTVRRIRRAGLRPRLSLRFQVERS